jgi:hypothetical protein
MNAECATCGNEYDKAFQVITSDGRSYVFDSFECAVQALAPRCEHCNCHIIGHGVEVSGEYFCCTNCAEGAGRAGTRDRA